MVCRGRPLPRCASTVMRVACTPLITADRMRVSAARSVSCTGLLGDVAAVLSGALVGPTPRQETVGMGKFLADGSDLVYDVTMHTGVEVSAAGGLLERHGENGAEIAVVHRTRYQHVDGSSGDWVLPKGKAEEGESLEATALREVAEETGYHAEIVGPSFTIEYLVAGRPKVVCFIRMVAIAVTGELDTSEVEAVCWLSPAQAVARLTYLNERQLVRQVYGLDETSE